jgi:predicted secreted protein
MITISAIYGLAIYGIIWFLTLFLVLPFGVRTQDDIGNVEPGSAASAPEQPHIRKRFAATTLLSAVLYVCVHWLLTSPNALPFWSAVVPDFAR